MAYYVVDPWGEERADLRAGIIASTTANVMGGSKEPLRPADFMPNYNDDKSEPEDERREAKYSEMKRLFNELKHE